MFFSGDSSNRKRVDLGGRSSKERDRQVVLEQARIERKRRQILREQTAAAVKIQKYFRARKDLEMARFRVRQQFHITFGDRCQKADWHCFGPNSWFLRQLLFFFSANNAGDVALLIEACKLLLRFHHENGDIVSVFAGMDYSANHCIVNQRVKKLAYICMQAIYQNRNQLKNQLLMASTNTDMTAVILLNTVACLTNPELPWTCEVVDYLLGRRVFFLLRHVILSGVRDVTTPESRDSASSLEHVLVSITSHSGQHACCSNLYPKWSFSLQLLSIPFLWRHLPYFKAVFVARGLGKHYVHQLASVLPAYSSALPNDILQEYGGFGCLLANLLEVSGSVISEQCSADIAMDFMHVSSFLLEALPPVEPSAGENPIDDDITMEESEKESISPALQNQINNYMDPRILQRLVDCLFDDTWKSGYSSRTWPSNGELEIIGAVCTFLHVMFSTLQHEAIMMRVAYRTEIIPVLWNFIKCCYAHKRWPSFSMPVAHVPGDEPGWLLPLAVFSPLYRYMLKFLDNEEFYEMEKPLNLTDMKSLVIIIKEALWQLLWLMPGSAFPSQRLLKGPSSEKKLSIEVIKHRAKIAMSELLCQLQDWNSRKQFISPDDFHVAEATSDNFISQALVENSRASEILKQAPFLVPFTTRVKIFASELAASRQTHITHPALTRHRHQFKIRRDRILEDAFNQLSALSEDDLRAPIRVSFVNEFGVEEAGIDGGGIFKDFMEKIIQTAFDVQYGLFKETSDHSLYPNPGSALVNEEHLQYFHFLGSLLGKAMYEGILVDIPFATFFLSKLKEKSNFLHDLPSLDPELYRHLIFLKHYKGDISELELYFVVVNNEYGEQVEEELIPGGKDRRVTNENVIQFIHLMANYRLNYQIRSQSSYFLRGFQRLIRKEWLEMFNEHEIQLLVSGSLDVIDIDDLRSNTHYTGGYHPTHHVIETFWEVFKSFSLEHQKKFLKFVTGCSRGPLLGFKSLEPKFCIQRTGSNSPIANEDLDRLPTSATCMNLLKLPPYDSKERMQTKLLYAISAEAGFDLS